MIIDYNYVFSEIDYNDRLHYKVFMIKLCCI